MNMAELGLALGIGSLLGTIWLRHQDEAVYLEQVAALEAVLVSARSSYLEHCVGTASNVPLVLPAVSSRANHGWSATLFTGGAGHLELRGVAQRHAQRLANRFQGKADGGALKLPLPVAKRLPSASHQRQFLRQYASADSDVCALH